MNLIGLTLDQALDGEDERNFDAGDFGYDELGFVNMLDLTLQEDDRTETGKLYVLTASCSESLAFHRGLHPELFEAFESEDDDPELTAEAFQAVTAVFSEHFDGIDILGDEDGYLAFNVSVTEQRGDFPIDALDEGTLWPILAQIANESDPGTFGHEYIWDTVAKLARDLREEAEAESE